GGVWSGRLFFNARKSLSRSLVYADARTGARLWRRVLPRPSGFTNALRAPVVTETGAVILPETDPTIPLQAFSAADGRPIAASALPGVMAPGVELAHGLAAQPGLFPA